MGKEGYCFFYIDITSQLIVLGFKLAEALLLRGERLADARAAGSLFIALGQSAPYRHLAELQVSADVAHTQILPADHLHDLQLELRVECSSYSLAQTLRLMDFIY